MAAILCLGEILIDLIPATAGQDLEAADCFLKAAGGAPANVAIGLARLGTSAAFLGCVGDDGFGRFLAATLAAEGVDIAGLRVSAAAPTALAAVSLDAAADRDFLFYGHPAAHTLLSPADIDEAAIQEADVLHIGSISLIGGALREATLHAVALARRWGKRVSYDPNLRLSLWPSADAAREGLRLGLSLADLVKIGSDEIAFLCGDACDVIEGARALWHPRLRLMAVTCGARGALWISPDDHGTQPAFDVQAVDTTGAGDAFTAGLLFSLAGREAPTRADLDGALRFASAAGALATTGRGAAPAMPDRAAVLRLLKGSPPPGPRR